MYRRGAGGILQSISLTGTIVSARNQLFGLFASGTRVWRFMPSVSLPILQGGRLRTQLGGGHGGP
jgi:multidrug efflux system outer membrane protein